MTQITSPKIRGAQTVIYPESDGKPMAETEIHRDLMIDMIDMLKNHFKDRPDAYVSGNLLLYYEKGNPQKSVAPDVFVAFGVEKKRRRTYLLWEEGKGPDVVIELVSKSTYQHDLSGKKELYARVLGVKEYYLYDPERQYLSPSLQGYRLAGDFYRSIQPVANRLPSFVLGLELGEEEMELGLYNPETQRWLLKPVEEEALARRQAESETEQAEARAQQAETRANRAEAELARLRAEFERLRSADE